MDGDLRSAAMSTWSLVGVVLTLTLAYTGSRVYELPKSGRPEQTTENQAAEPGTEVLYTHLWNDPLSADVLKSGLDAKPFLERVAESCPKGEADLKVIFVLLNDKPHPEDIEERRRFRFGLHSALAHKRYKPLDAESLHVGAAPLVTSKPCIPFEWAESYDQSNLASSTGRKKLMLIAYINERQFLDGSLTKPEDLAGLVRPPEATVGFLEDWADKSRLRRLCGLRYLIEKRFQEASSIGKGIDVDPAVRILGPTKSSILRDFMSSADPTCYKPNTADEVYGAPVYAFSAGASVPFATLKRNIDADTATNIVIDSKHDTLCMFNLAGKPVQLSRLGSDAQLTNLITHELNLRDALPGKEHEHVILLAEQDTEYGLGMVDAFKDSVLAESHRSDPDSLDRFIHTIWFARGLDGYTSAAQNQSAGDPRGGKSPNSNLPALAGRGLTGGTAHGNAQTDYFERLRGEIVMLRERLWLKGECVNSMGLLGFDVYDKVLILRALRHELPDVHFFTLDLDAELLTREHYRFTHNLIIASHYGLSPFPTGSPRLGGQADARNGDIGTLVLPFRHSYQTACFLGTLKLIEDIPPPIPSHPRVFEIGRYGAVPLEPRSTSETDTNSLLVGVQVSIPLIFIVIFLFIFYSSSAYYSLGHLFGLIGLDTLLGLDGNSRRRDESLSKRLKRLWKVEDIGLVCMLLLSIALLLLVLFVADRADRAADEEPLYWLSGVSAWPTLFVRALVVGVGMVLFFLHFSRVSWGFDKIQRDFPDLACKLDTEILPGDRVVRLLRAILPWVHLSPEERNSPHPQAMLWQRYRAMSDVIATSIRITVPAFLLFCFFLCSISYTHSYFNPIRGASSSFWSGWLLYGNALVLCYLVALAVDQARLCLSFARHLHDVDSTWKRTLCENTFSHSGKKGLSLKGNAYATTLPDLFDLEVVARASEVISRAIYFPCVLLVLSMLGRVSLFDNWNWPIPLVALISIAFLSCIGAQWQMNSSCTRIRGRYLEELEKRWLRASGDDERAAIEYTKIRIRNLDLGAFRNFVETPLARAMLLPLGGLSGVSLLQQLATFYW